MVRSARTPLPDIGQAFPGGVLATCAGISKSQRVESASPVSLTVPEDTGVQVQQPMTSKPAIAYVISGFIGAGKTTFSRKLEKETGAIRITKDEWVVKIFGNKIALDSNFERYDKNITELATDIAFKILKAGKDVILDEGFWIKAYRYEVKKKISDIGGKPILYYVECSVETMRERVVNRSKSPPEDSFEISVEMFDSYLQYWQPPEEDEEFILAE
jgi:predicted kinase